MTGVVASLGIPLIPSAPPVIERLFANTRTISPNPTVAMARKIPRRRRTGRARSAATIVAAATPVAIVASSGQWAFIARIAETYAAMPMNAACASASWPAWSDTESDSAKIALMPI